MRHPAKGLREVHNPEVLQAPKANGRNTGRKPGKTGAVGVAIQEDEFRSGLLGFRGAEGLVAGGGFEPPTFGL